MDNDCNILFTARRMQMARMTEILRAGTKGGGYHVRYNSKWEPFEGNSQFFVARPLVA